MRARLDKLESSTLQGYHYTRNSYDAAVRWFGNLAEFVDKLLARVLGLIGMIVSHHPYVVIICTVLFVAMCCPGFLALRREARGEKLWAPQESRAYNERGFYRKYFASFDDARIQQVISVNPDGDNVLTREGLLSLQTLHEAIEQVNVTVNGDLVSLDTKCVRDGGAGSDCLISCILEVWDFNRTLLENDPDPVMSLNFWLDMEGDDPKYYLGGYTQNNFGRVVDATAFRCVYFMVNDEDDKGYDEDGMKWELELLEEVDRDIFGTIKAYINAHRSLDDAFEDALDGDVVIFLLGYILIMGYVIIALGDKCNLVRSKVLLAIGGIVNILMAVAVAIALGSALGIFYGPINAIMPFVLLGIGADDLFILVDRATEVERKHPRKNINWRIKKTLQHAGVSITITTFTDMAAFAIGGTTTLLGLRSFCFYMTIGIFFDYVFQITFFTALMVLDARRVQASRAELCPLIKVPYKCCGTGLQIDSSSGEERTFEELEDGDGEDSLWSAEESGSPRGDPSTEYELDDVSADTSSLRGDRFPSAKSFSVESLAAPVRPSPWWLRGFWGLAHVIFNAIATFCTRVSNALALPSTRQQIDEFTERDCWQRATFWYYRGKKHNEVPKMRIPKRKLSATLAYHCYAWVLLQKPTKIAVIFLSLALLAGGIVGALNMHQDFDRKDYIASDASLQDFYDLDERYFKEIGIIIDVVTKEFDYYKDQDDILVMEDEFRNNHWVEGEIDSWYDEYLAWVRSDPVKAASLNEFGLPSSETNFYVWLRTFLDTVGTEYQDSVIFEDDSRDYIISSLFRTHSIELKDAVDQVDCMNAYRRVADRQYIPTAVYSYAFIFYEMYAIIADEMIRNLCLAMGAASLAVWVFIVTPLSVILTVLCVCLTMIDIFGWMYLTGMVIDSVSAVMLTASIGLAVDYSVHMSHAFQLTQAKSLDKRVQITIGTTGVSVLHGAFTTTIAVLVFAFSTSYIFVSLFKIFLGVVVFGTFNGMVLLPVLLSLFGAAPHPHADDCFARSSADLSRLGKGAKRPLRLPQAAATPFANPRVDLKDGGIAEPAVSNKRLAERAMVESVHDLLSATDVPTYLHQQRTSEEATNRAGEGPTLASPSDSSSSVAPPSSSSLENGATSAPQAMAFQADEEALYPWRHYYFILRAKIMQWIAPVRWLHRKAAESTLWQVMRADL